MPKRCIPCIGGDIKAAAIKLGDVALNDMLAKIPDCPGAREIQFCGNIKGTRPRSAYQEFVSTCMRGKNIKGFGEAPKAMKECAADWRKSKGK